ncbi:MAG: ATP-binding protein, partial [Pseudonocardiaceae bacterium]
MWGRVAVFAGSFELDAAEEVCGADLTTDDVLEAVTSLVDKSILIREESGTVVRFRLLETVREYGREKLEQTGEDLLLRRRHRDWYQGLAVDAEAEWISARQLEWISRLRREQPNIREALEFSVTDDPAAGLRTAAALFSFWLSQGLYGEGRRCTIRLLDHEAGAPTLDRVKALLVASVLAGVQGDLQAGAGLVARVRALAAQTSNPMVGALIAYADGALATYNGDLTRACAQLEGALAVLAAGEIRALETGVLSMLGVAYELRGETDRAIAYHERVLAITEACGEAQYRSYSLWALGVAVWQQGDADRAVRLLEQSLQLTRQANIPRIAASCLEALAW